MLIKMVPRISEVFLLNVALSSVWNCLPVHSAVDLNGQNSLRDPQNIDATPKLVGLKNEVDAKLEIYDGVYVSFPTSNGSLNGMVSLKVDLQKDNEGRGKQKKLLERILPLFIMPFLVQSAIIPIFLSTLKFMLFKSLMVGKVALALIAFNAFRNSNTFKGREDERMADAHYGYHGVGMEEYGAYVNK